MQTPSTAARSQRSKRYPVLTDLRSLCLSLSVGRPLSVVLPGTTSSESFSLCRLSALRRGVKISGSIPLWQLYSSSRHIDPRSPPFVAFHPYRHHTPVSPASSPHPLGHTWVLRWASCPHSTLQRKTRPLFFVAGRASRGGGQDPWHQGPRCLPHSPVTPPPCGAEARASIGDSMESKRWQVACPLDRRPYAALFSHLSVGGQCAFA